MIIHVEIAHPKLYVLRKQQFNEVAKPVDVHVWQLGKKRIGPFNHTITNFLVPQIHTKKNDEQQ